MKVKLKTEEEKEAGIVYAIFLSCKLLGLFKLSRSTLVAATEEPEDSVKVVKDDLDF